MDATELFDNNIGLVGFLARQIWETMEPKHRYEIQDFFQEGSIGLWKACQSFKPELGYQFSTFAGRCIKNEILMSLRKERKRALEMSLDRELESGPGDDMDKITFLDLMPSNDNVESEIVAKEMYDFYEKKHHLRNYRPRKPRVEAREKRVFEFMIRGVRQCEMKPTIGVSQRVLAYHMASIRKRIAAEYMKG